MEFYSINSEIERFRQIAFHGGQERIYASGLIEFDTSAQFEEFIVKNKIEWAKVYFNSPGGSLIGGMQLGRSIRRLGFDTTIGTQEGSAHTGKPICASAAAYAFAGGIGRFYGEDCGRLGIHQFANPEDNVGDIGDAQVVSALIVSYLQEMGVDASAFAAAAQARSENMIWLSASEAAQLKLANDGVLETTASIRLWKGVPYLRIEQISHNVTARILVFYNDGLFSVMGGIVTTAEVAAENIGCYYKSCIEFDDTRLLSSNFASIDGDTIWVERDLDDKTVLALKSAAHIGVWLESNGAVRWGALADIHGIANDIAYFIDNCQPDNSPSKP